MHVSPATSYLIIVLLAIFEINLFFIISFQGTERLKKSHLLEPKMESDALKSHS